MTDGDSASTSVARTRANPFAVAEFILATGAGLETEWRAERQGGAQKEDSQWRNAERAAPRRSVEDEFMQLTKDKRHGRGEEPAELVGAEETAVLYVADRYSPSVHLRRATMRMRMRSTRSRQ